MTPLSAAHTHRLAQAAQLVVWAILGGIFFAVLLMQLFIVPLNADELATFYPTACRSHQQVAGLVMETCNRRITILHLLTITNANPYVGGTLDLLFRPFFYLSPSVYSLYLFTFSFWALCLWCVSRLLQVPLYMAFIGLGMHYAFLYHILHSPETIPANVGMLLIPLLAARAVQSGKPVVYGLLAGVVAAVAFEAKVFFFYMLPATAALAAGAMLMQVPVATKKTFLRFVLSGACLSGTLVALLLTGTLWNAPYWKELLWYPSGVTLPDYFNHLGSYFLYYWRDFGNVMHRVYAPQWDIPDWQRTDWWTWTFWSIGVAVVATALVFERRRRLLKIRLGMLVVACVAAAALALLCVAANNMAWAHHHYFYGITLLSVSFTAGLQALWLRRWGKPVVLCIALLLATGSLCSTIAKTLQVPLPRVTADRDRIVEWLKQEKVGNHVVAVGLSWGMDHTMALFGPHSQIFTGIFRKDMNNREIMEHLRNVSREVNRPVVFLGIRAPHFIDQATQYFGPLYDITPQVMKTPLANPLLDTACLPPWWGMEYLCSHWQDIRREGQWAVWSNVPYDRLFTK